MNIEGKIVEMAIANGATIAGITNSRALKHSASHAIYKNMGDYDGIGKVKDGQTLSQDQLFNWSEKATSVLVIGLAHPKAQLELDWWDGRGTPGNRRLIDIIKRTGRDVESKLKLKIRGLHYYVEKGGVFLKDAAVLAGLGCVGRNNLLVTPASGPRVRLRALFIDTELAPTGPINFDPCADCKVNCRKVCPEKAMDTKAEIFQKLDASVELPARDGAFDRHICNVRMEKDVAARVVSPSGDPGPIKYCRRCEFVCPVGRKAG